jgi:6-phosphogluconolactonase/glucosamine-6-phosphate isomerase/deaminase
MENEDIYKNSDFKWKKIKFSNMDEKITNSASLDVDIYFFSKR